MWIRILIDYKQHSRQTTVSHNKAMQQDCVRDCPYFSCGAETIDADKLIMASVKLAIYVDNSPACQGTRPPLSRAQVVTKACNLNADTRGGLC